MNQKNVLPVGESTKRAGGEKDLQRPSGRFRRKSRQRATSTADSMGIRGIKEGYQN